MSAEDRGNNEEEQENYATLYSSPLTKQKWGGLGPWKSEWSLHTFLI